MNDITSATSSTYLDFSALAQLKGDAARDPSQAIRKTAEQFEAYFIQQMMKTMRESIEKSDLVDGGNMDMYQDLMDKEVSLSMAKRVVWAWPTCSSAKCTKPKRSVHKTFYRCANRLRRRTCRSTQRATPCRSSRPPLRLTSSNDKTVSSLKAGHE
jgi:hypothetical protein